MSLCELTSYPPTMLHCGISRYLQEFVLIACSLPEAFLEDLR